MNIKTAKNIIDFEMDYVTKSDYYVCLNLELFGGEPFLEFNLMKDIVDYVKSKIFKKEISILITTNGTLVHGKIQEWLKENTDLVQCCLSLDGTKKMHDINRCNSFDRIDLKFFRETYPEEKVKMTISPESLPFLSEGVIFCHNNGFNVGCNLAFGIDWTDNNNLRLLKRELEKLSDYYLNNPTVVPCDMLGEPIRTRRSNTDMCRKWCGVGTHTCSYDTFGNKYPCQFFMPISMGDELSRKGKDMIFNDFFPLSNINEKCRNCVYEPSCPTCIASNYKRTGNPYKRDETMCDLYKLIIDARCDYLAHRWESGHLDFDKETEVETLMSIVKIEKQKRIS